MKHLSKIFCKEFNAYFTRLQLGFLWGILVVTLFVFFWAEAFLPETLRT